MSKNDTDKSTYQDFIYLRAAIVRSIGLAWRDEDFEKEFKANPKKAMKAKFGYKFPFDLDFDVKKDNTKYNWTSATTGGWSGPNNVLSMKLPPKPDRQEDVADALAAYNFDRLNFMSK